MQSNRMWWDKAVCGLAHHPISYIWDKGNRAQSLAALRRGEKTPTTQQQNPKASSDPTSLGVANSGIDPEQWATRAQLPRPGHITRPPALDWHHDYWVIYVSAGREKRASKGSRDWHCQVVLGLSHALGWPQLSKEQWDSWGVTVISHVGTVPRAPILPDFPRHVACVSQLPQQMKVVAGWKWFITLVLAAAVIRSHSPWSWLESKEPGGSRIITSLFYHRSIGSVS